MLCMPVLPFPPDFTTFLGVFLTSVLCFLMSYVCFIVCLCSVVRFGCEKSKLYFCTHVVGYLCCACVSYLFFVILQFNELGLFSSLALLRCSVWLREVNGWLFDLIFSYFSTFFVCFGKFRALLMSIVNAFLYVCPLFC